MSRFNLDNYVDVQERINRFWHEHPNGAILTRLMSPPDNFDICRYEAQVLQNRDDPHPAATGYAYEWREQDGRGPNVTSHEENCETSAIGRALANMGYAKNREERPSRQEMAKADRDDQPRQAAPVPLRQPQGNGEPRPQARPGNPASERQIKAIHAIAHKLDMDDAELHEFAEVETFTGLSSVDASKLIDRLQGLLGNS